MTVLFALTLVVTLALWAGFEVERRNARRWRMRALQLEFVILNRAIEPPDPRGRDD